MTERTAPRGWWRAWGPPGVLLVIVLATIVSRVGQARESLWLDELHTAWVASGALHDVVSRSLHGNQSPLFFWLEWLIVRGGGAGEVALRSPSLVAGAAMPIVLYGVVRAWTGSSWLALLPALLAAIDPQTVYFGTEARPYALVQVLVIVYVALFVEMVRHPTPGKRLAAVLIAAAMFHLHSTSALAIVAVWIWYAAWRRCDAPAYGWRDFTVDLVAVVALCTPAAGLMRVIAGRRHNWEAFVRSAPLWVGFEMLPWGLTALGATLWTLWRVRTQDAVPGRPQDAVPGQPQVAADVASAVACWLVLPVVIAWVATGTDVAHLMWPRYLAAAAPATFIMLALAVHLVPRRGVRALAGGAMTVAAMAVSPVPVRVAQGRRPIDWRLDDWRGAIAYFNTRAGHRQGAVLVRTGLIESDALGGTRDSAFVAYVLYPVTSVYPIDATPDRLVPLRRSAPARLAVGVAELVSRDSVAWIVLDASASSAAAITTSVCSALSGPGHRWRMASQESFGSVVVARLVRE